MADYATLKAAIAAAIKQNGNNEITGNLLQQQLLAMVNSLGVGYQYAGIATPATNPGTPDQNVFYIASEAGAYSNFGGLVVNDYETAILKYNGTWTKDVTGVANAAKTESDIKSLSDILDSISLKFIKREPDSVITEQYFNGSGAFVSSANFDIWQYGNIVPGTKYAFSGYRSPSSTPYFLAWYAADGTTCVKVEPYKGGSTVVRYTEQPVIAPEGAAYAFLNVRTSAPLSHGFFDTERVSIVTDDYLFGGVATPSTDPGALDKNVFFLASTPGLYDNMGGLVVNDGEICILKYNGTWTKENTGIATEADVKELQELIYAHAYLELTPSSVDDARMNTNGTIELSTTVKLLTFPVTGGKEYAFSGKMPRTVTINFLGWYDANNEFIAIEPYRGNNQSEVIYDKKRVVAPANAAYAKMNAMNAQLSYAKLYEITQNLSIQDVYEGLIDYVKKTDVIDNLISDKTNAPLSANQGRVLKDEIRNIDYDLREKVITLQEPAEILENTRSYGGNIEPSSLVDLYVYEINPTLQYCFSGRFPATVSMRFVGYYNENDEFISYDVYRGQQSSPVKYEEELLHIPENAKYAKMNVYRSNRSAFSLSEVKLGDYRLPDDVGSIKVVVNEDKSFYVRHHIDNENDGLLLFDYYKVYAYDNNSIMARKYCVGAKDLTDEELLDSGSVQNCADMQSPMFTENFGPMFSNHGYSIPRVNIPIHGLTSDDIGTEWVDQNDYHYTIGQISGNYIYLLPVINSTGVPGQETRQWKWYNSPYPTEITRNVPGGETLQVTSSSRWDIQVSELRNVRVIINGKSVDAGKYICEQVVLSYEQDGYNPVQISTWFPRPVYNGIMTKFARHFTVTGGDGFLSMTSNTVVNNMYPFPLHHYIDVVPQFPRPMGDYSPHVFIPKMKKVASGIDFREEFVPVPGVTTIVNYFRRDTDLVDVNDMPDRAYCYMMDGNGGILYGCAGGHSLVRGMSVKSVRNQYIAMNGNVGAWNPGAGNKHYNNILLTTGEEDNIMPDTFLNEFEGYVCWYKPKDGVQCFYHRTKEGYVVYIHTNVSAEKGVAVLPDFMDNFAVSEIVEQTIGIALLTNTVIDGRIYFSADTSEIEYQYIVLLLKP